MRALMLYFFLKTLAVSGQHPPPDPFSRLKQMKEYLWSSLVMTLPFPLVHVYAFS